MAFYRDQNVPHARSSGRGKLILGVIAVIVVAAVSFVFFGSGGVTNISQSGQLHLTNASTLFSTSTGEYMIYFGSGSSSGATVYVGKLPALVNPLLKVSLTAGNTTRINVGTSYSNLELTLSSAGKSSADVIVTALDPALQINPDAGSISLVQGGLRGTAQNNNILGATANITTTTVPQNLLSQTTTIPTTTISQANVSYNTAITTWHTSKYYTLMANYTKLYENTTGCTASNYNSTYREAVLFGYVQGPGIAITFQNASKMTPYDMYSNFTDVDGGNYKVAYYTKTKDPTTNNTAVLTLIINASNKNVLNFNYTGAFQGESYAAVLSGYQAAVKLGGACGIEIA
ncbi:MAG: hypothetical protein KGH60_01990 [Candidatus Micrarchaeota archaeon]|nr:hypothetical protein [Candidatus Micrarchaeota archaeon]